MTPSLSRRPALLTTLGVLLVTALPTMLTACSGGNDDSTDAASSPSSPSTAERTLDGEYGPVSVDGTPERVVALSSDWLGTMVATDAPLVGFRTAGPAAPVDTPPWLADRLGSDLTHLTGDFTVESVAALDPDLIVGPNWLVDEDLYGRLSDIAPTYVDHEDSTGTEFGNWERQLDDAGTLLGTDTAPVKKNLEDNIRSAAEEHHLDGTAALAGVQGDQIAAVTSTDAGISYLLKPFGLAPLDIPGQKVGLRTMVSAENASALTDADLLIMGPSDLAGDALDRYTAGREGKATRTVPMSTLNAFNTPDASSIPLLLDEITAALEGADDADD
ncbi:MAG: ABC transporter substrate-binding protein [Corynebacterium variabile]|uniref:ABC transporter substrate-binding protein n=1 Tax=Corynebacterium variabile TaxID=1727 RepID=UPI003FB67445